MRHKWSSSRKISRFSELAENFFARAFRAGHNFAVGYAKKLTASARACARNSNAAGAKIRYLQRGFSGGGEIENECRSFSQFTFNADGAVGGIDELPANGQP